MTLVDQEECQELLDKHSKMSEKEVKASLNSNVLETLKEICVVSSSAV